MSSPVHVLRSTCYASAGCTEPRLPYGAYCVAHTPGQAAPAARCVAPLRCYCPTHTPMVRFRYTRGVPKTVRDALASALAQRESRA